MACEILPALSLSYMLIELLQTLLNMPLTLLQHGFNFERNRF
jgi:hypothetical protein